MNRIRAYREIERISGAETGQLLGVSTSMVSQVERGDRPLTISLEALGYGEHRFEVPEMSEPHHRQLSRTRVKSTRRAKELLRLGGEVYNELSGRLKPRPVLLERLGPLTDYTRLPEMAQDVRGALGVEHDVPIKNLTRAVERAGICLVPIADLDGIDGISAWVEDRPVIGVAPEVPGDRFRLTLAHEIGHLVMHTRAGEHSEHEANRFASHLLLPAEEFWTAVTQEPQIKDFGRIKSHWGISIAALIYRAHEEEIIDDQRYRSLQIQMSKWRKKEPGGFVPVYGQVLSGLVADFGGAAAVQTELGLSAKHVSLVSGWHPDAARGHLRLVSQ